MLARMMIALRVINAREAARLEDSRKHIDGEQLETKSVLRRKICSLWPVLQKPLTGEVPNILPPASLSPPQFLPFIREVENIILNEGISPVIVYWARNDAAHLLPDNPCFDELFKAADCVSIFSEQCEKPPNEWLFVVESRELSLSVYGRQETGEMDQSAENLDPRAIDGPEPDSSRVPKKPYPYDGRSHIALPEPEIPTES
jgi:hypothetical protein